MAVVRRSRGGNPEQPARPRDPGRSESGYGHYRERSGRGAAQRQSGHVQFRARLRGCLGGSRDRSFRHGTVLAACRRQPCTRHAVRRPDERRAERHQRQSALCRYGAAAARRPSALRLAPPWWRLSAVGDRRRRLALGCGAPLLPVERRLDHTRGCYLSAQTVPRPRLSS